LRRRNVSRETGGSEARRGEGVGILATPPWSPSRPAGRGTQITAVTLLTAVLIGILHAAVAPILVVGNVHPNLLVVAVALVTVLNGFGSGVAVAFIGGLTANLLVRDPLGSLPLELLLLTALVAGGERLFGRLAWVYPLAAVALGSILVELVSLAILQLLDAPLGGGLPAGRIAAAALLNTAIAAIVILPTRLLLARAAGGEKAAW
jgi:cell shape-determining protein MreD